MPYIKRIASIVNGADSCGGGMKKQGLVYGSDWARISSNVIQSKAPINYTFSLYGAAKKDCCSERKTNGVRLNRATQRTNAD